MSSSGCGSLAGAAATPSSTCFAITGRLVGLETNGRAESFLMSLPPLVRWDEGVMATPGSPEAELLAPLRPIDWLQRTR